MKRIILLLMFTGVLVLSGKAQTLPLPDTAFVNCLAKKYPATLDTSGHLILSQAANLSGALQCSHWDIQDAEGVQYFTGITELDLSNNRLSFLPDISGLKQLQELNAGNNQLLQLPSLVSLDSLKGLSVESNLLTSLPSFSPSKALEILYVHSNNLGSLPDLTGFSRLKHINAPYCNLDSLPDLSTLIALQKLECWKNNLTILPDLSTLPDIQYVNASYNRIKEFPHFKNPAPVDTIYLEFNALDSLPDFSTFPVLKKLRVYNNSLTFEDLLSILHVPGYDTLIPFRPQNVFQVGIQRSVIESDAVEFNTGIDTNVNGVHYSWYFRGQVIKSVSSPTLIFSSVVPADSGYYYCRISHPDFPGFYLQTDSFQLEVLPCLSVDHVSTQATSITCTQPGTLTVEANAQPVPGPFSYHLVSTLTHDTLHSSTGVFTQLAEPNYTLSISYKNCTRQYPNLVYIPQDLCKEVVITPNGDGVDEEYFFNQSGQVIIRDKWGNIVQQLTIPAAWSGRGYSGKVPPGLYFADINKGEEIIKLSVIF